MSSSDQNVLQLDVPAPTAKHSMSTLLPPGAESLQALAAGRLPHLIDLSVDRDASRNAFHSHNVTVDASSEKAQRDWSKRHTIWMYYVRCDVEASFMEYYYRNRLLPIFAIAVLSVILIDSFSVRFTSDAENQSIVPFVVDAIVYSLNICCVSGILVARHRTSCLQRQRDAMFADDGSRDPPPSQPDQQQQLATSPASSQHFGSEQAAATSNGVTRIGTVRGSDGVPHVPAMINFAIASNATQQGDAAPGGRSVFQFQSVPALNNGSEIEHSDKFVDGILWWTEFHEAMCCLAFFCSVLVGTIGSAPHGICHGVNKAYYYEACENSILNEAYALMAMTASVYFWPMRLRSCVFMFSIMCALQIISHLLPSNVAQHITLSAYLSLILMTIVEAVASFAVTWWKELRARDHFELFVDLQRKTFELQSVRRQTEVMVAAQVPLAAVRQGVLGNEAGLWGYNPQSAVCCIVLEGFGPWCARRSPVDSVELLRSFLDTMDRVLASSRCSPTKFHAFADQYVVSVTPGGTPTAVREACAELLMVALHLVVAADDSLFRTAMLWGTRNSMLTQGNEVECMRSIDTLRIRAVCDVGSACGMLIGCSANMVLLGHAIDTARTIAHKYDVPLRCRKVLILSHHVLPFISSLDLFPTSSTCLQIATADLAHKLVSLSNTALREGISAVVGLLDKKIDVCTISSDELLSSCGLLSSSTDNSIMSFAIGPKNGNDAHSEPLVKRELPSEAVGEQFDATSPAECKVAVQLRFFLFPRFLDSGVEEIFSTALAQDEAPLMVFNVQCACLAALMAALCCLVSPVIAAPNVLVAVACLVLVALQALTTAVADMQRNGPRLLFTLWFVLFTIAMCATYLTAPEGNLLRHSPFFVLFLICCQTLKFPFWFGVLMLGWAELAISLVFLWDEYSWRRIGLNTSSLFRTFNTLVFVTFPTGIFACRVRMAITLREEFAVRHSVLLLHEELMQDYERLESVLQQLAPKGFAKGLIDNARSCKDAATKAFTLHPDLSTNVTTATDEVPFLVLQLRAISVECGVDEGLLREAAKMLHSAMNVAAEALVAGGSGTSDGGSCRGVEIVKASSDMLVAAVAMEPMTSRNNKTEQRSYEILVAAKRVATALRAMSGRVEFKMFIGCGQLMGAVLGCENVSFEYYGGKLSVALHLIEELEWRCAVASSQVLRCAWFYVDSKLSPLSLGVCRYDSSLATVDALLPLRNDIDLGDPTWCGEVPGVSGASFLTASAAVPMATKGFYRQFVRHISFVMP